MKKGLKIFESELGGYCLTITDWSEEVAAVFDERDLQGGGHTWAGVCRALLALYRPELAATIEFEPEHESLYAYSRSRESLSQLASLVVHAMNDHGILQAAIAQAGEALE
jgi:hypothetical protein